jgi:hypothetical protein
MPPLQVFESLPITAEAGTHLEKIAQHLFQKVEIQDVRSELVRSNVAYYLKNDIKMTYVLNAARGLHNKQVWQRGSIDLLIEQLTMASKGYLTSADAGFLRAAAVQCLRSKTGFAYKIMRRPEDFEGMQSSDTIYQDHFFVVGACGHVNSGPTDTSVEVETTIPTFDAATNTRGHITRIIGAIEMMVFGGYATVSRIPESERLSYPPVEYTEAQLRSFLRNWMLLGMYGSFYRQCPGPKTEESLSDTDTATATFTNSFSGSGTLTGTKTGSGTGTATGSQTASDTDTATDSLTSTDGIKNGVPKKPVTPPQP